VGGIGFMLRRLAAERAESAYQAVQIIGGLLNRYGYYSSGRTLCIADKDEGWILHMVKGKHWIAQRVPDDEVAVIPNYYTIKNIDLKDKKNFLGSADIISYARKKGWYKPLQDGEFDFARVYSDPENYKSMINILRQWRATNLLSKEKFNVGQPLPFSFKPKRKIRIADCFRVLRDHYEDTEYDLSNDYRNGSPNSTKHRTICTKTTRYSFVAEMRSELPQEISNRVWIALGRPDSNAYSPWYFSLLSSPLGYTRKDSQDELKTHFLKPKNYFVHNSKYAFFSYAKLSQLVDLNYRVRIKTIKKEWKNYELYVRKNLKKKEKEFMYLIKRNKNIAQKMITNYIHNLEYRKWFLSTQLMKDILKK
jgi:dipeptidase